MTRALGVGILGAGQATQAIHLPTLAGLSDRFRVVRVMDIDVDLAERVAARCGAAYTGDDRTVIEDPDVDVVAVCSPHNLHAAQVIASCEAGKLAVLCEKPLALTRTEVDEIAAAARASGTHLVVGAMHVYDPAYRAALAAWELSGDVAVLSQSTIFLPPNDVFVEQATEPVPVRPTGFGGNQQLEDAVAMRSAIVGLAVHDLPLIRRFHPRLGLVVSARCLSPFGYSIVAADGDATVELLAVMGGSWQANWTFRVVGAKHELRVTFPPSYVLAGSARARLVSKDRAAVFEFEESGYQRQWRSMHDVVCEIAAPLVAPQDALDDIVYVLDLADHVGSLLEPRP